MDFQVVSDILSKEQTVEGNFYESLLRSYHVEFVMVLKSQMIMGLIWLCTW